MKVVNVRSPIPGRGSKSSRRSGQYAVALNLAGVIAA